MSTPRLTVGRAPGALPLVGHIFHLLLRPLRFFSGLRGHGDIVTIRLGSRPVIVVNHPDVIRQILVTDARHFDKGLQFERARDYVGNGLATAGEPHHRGQRRLIQPAFHHASVVRYVDIMRDVAAATLDTWPHGAPIELESALLRFTIRALTATLFSTRADASMIATVTESLPAFLGGIAWRVALPTRVFERLPLPANRRFDAGNRRLRATIDRIVADRRARPGAGEDLLDMLLAARDEATGAGMTDEQIRDEVMTMMLAGSETTASILGWILHLLGTHPDVQRAVHAELDEVVGRRPISADDLTRLPYLRRVVRETLRLYPPAWLISRRALTDVSLGGYTVPAGSDVFFSAYGVHRDPAYYANPAVFDPGRWTTQSERSKTTPTFLAFGAGPRGCIGEAFAWSEVLIFTATLLQRCCVRPPPRLRVRAVARGLLHGSPLATVLTARGC